MTSEAVDPAGTAPLPAADRMLLLGLDAAGGIAYRDRAATALLGRVTHLHDVVVGAPEPMWQALRDGAELAAEVKITDADGAVRQGVLSLHPTDEPGPVAALATLALGPCTAMNLQYSLLPGQTTAPSAVEVYHRYLPGRPSDVGGDWYESIALPGGRVALVVGDVEGRGVRAAVTMGRLRAALHTLTTLELAPGEILRRLDEVMRGMADRDIPFATCVYAVYDAVTGILEVAAAGQLPPLLARPGEEPEFLDLPPAPPLGMGTGTVVGREFEVAEDAVLVLYTDGLVESRACDVDEGLHRLREIFGPGATDRPLRELGHRALASVGSEQDRDDLALLIARLGRIPSTDHVTWELPAVAASVREARTLIRDRLARWGLSGLSFTAELLATELLTNVVRHVGGRMALSLIMDDAGLVIEVYDASDAMPRQRHPEPDTAEGGRGLHVVERLTRGWGHRRTIAGKVVWGEIPLP